MKRLLGIISGLLLAPTIATSQVDLGTDAQRNAGQKIYDQMCSQCHGYDGDANGVAKYRFNPRPRDFTYGLYKIRTTPNGDLPTHDDLKKVIRDGMPYTGMPAWENLSGQDLDNVVYYIKTFADFSDPDFIVPSINIPKAPGFSEGSAELGRALYVENKCADCHGDTGHGNGKSSATLTNDWEESIRPADLTRRWTFRGGSTREDIYRTFTTGLNGTPMPSYADLINEEERWHLVDYVYSLSRDEPDYATVLMAHNVEGDIDISQGAEQFAAATAAYFPVFGQIMEPGRSFYPSSNGVEVKVICNATEIAFMIRWSDMTAEDSGVNSLTMPAGNFDPDVEATEVGDASIYSDAIAVQTPSQNPKGFVKPYFLSGDSKNPVDIWFADMARNEGDILTGKGSEAIESTGDTFPMNSSYEEGQWTVIFKRPRSIEDGLSFDDGAFVPISFSTWDGFNAERGNKRGVTSWYNVYTPPLETESKAMAIAGYGLLTLILELALIGIVRRRSGRAS